MRLDNKLVVVTVLALVAMPVPARSAPPAAAPASTADEPPAAPPPVANLAALEAAYRVEADEKRRAKLVRDMAALPGSAEALARVVEADASDEVALSATYALRRLAMGGVVRALDRRLAASGKRDPAARERLVRELERHQVYAAGQSLPHFLREAPPVFTVKAESRRSARVLAFGDFGDGSERQQRLAETMRRAHATKPFDFAITLGDNFYPAGMNGPEDPRWERDFVHLYGPMRIRFFPSLGNHDWILTDSPAAEILHAPSGGAWRMPADRYSFVAGPVQFFAIDTNLISRAQLDWLDRELSRSTARWKVVYGHHPIYSHGFHGDEPVVRDNLLPLLRGRVQLYICGHEHDLQQLAPDGGVNFVIAGGGGASPRPITPGPRTLFAAGKNGFAVLDATRTTLAVSLVGESGETLHKFVLHAQGSAQK